MMSRVFSSILLVLAFMAAHAANAQSEDNIYLTEKRDLANLLGRVHYVRTLCNGKHDQYWRNFMRDFLDLEATNKSRRSMFVKSFNYGYRFQSERMDHRCTANTALVEAQLAGQGRKLAESIARGYLR